MSDLANLSENDIIYTFCWDMCTIVYFLFSYIPQGTRKWLVALDNTNNTYRLWTVITNIQVQYWIKTHRWRLSCRPGNQQKHPWVPKSKIHNKHGCDFSKMDRNWYGLKTGLKLGVGEWNTVIWIMAASKILHQEPCGTILDCCPGRNYVSSQEEDGESQATSPLQAASWLS